MVRTEIAVPLERLPASVDLAAFRILQEALTNVIRHAGTTNALVRVVHDDETLVLEVEDDGRGLPSNGDGGLGTGIQGMRERAAALGGAVEAGSRTGGGFRVTRPTAAGHRRMIRVLLADDQALVRAGFRALLEAEPGIEVVGEAVNGEEAVRLATSLAPDVVLMDIRMPGSDGLEATRRIVSDERLAEVRIIILSTFDLDEYVFEALRLGASGFLVKDTEPSDLLRGVRAVARGDALLSPSITRRLIAEIVARSNRPGRRAASKRSPVGSAKSSDSWRPGCRMVRLPNAWS